MNFLSIDCSTDLGSLFIKVENKTFNKILQSDKYSNDLLMKQTLDFLHKNNLSLEDITEVLVNQGPGNFSGLRGAISICKGICLAKNIKLFGYNTFLLSSVKFYGTHESIYSFVKIREKYYMQKFNNKLIPHSKPISVTQKEIFSKYKNEIKIIGSQYAKNAENETLNKNNFNVVNLDYRQLEFLKKKNLLQKSPISPIYLY